MRIAYREWRVFIDTETFEPTLYSTFVNFPWDCAEVAANRTPEHDMDPETGRLKGNFGSLHGIHGVLTEHSSSWLTNWVKPHSTTLKAVGAMDVFGMVVEHKDGVVRAEGAKILALRLETTHPETAIAWNETEEAINSYQPEFKKYERPGTFQVCPNRQHCSSGGGYAGYFGQLYDDALPHALPHELPMSLEELEDLVLLKYSVPRLERGKGPWFHPYGERIPKYLIK